VENQQTGFVNPMAKIYGARPDYRRVTWDEEGSWILVGHFELQAHQDFMREFHRSFETRSRGRRQRTPSEKEGKARLMESFARVLVKDWGGPLFQGFPCTPENVLALLNDSSRTTAGALTLGEQFFGDLVLAASPEERKEGMEETKGNSSTPSGPSTGSEG
jgi:hypothetical protein